MNEDSLLGQLVDEFTSRVREGKPPDVEEYVNRYPQLAGRIRELFPTLMLLEGIGVTRCGTATQAMASPLSENSVFGSYHIKREIGRGGMGIVYEAVHALLEKKVALKVLPVGTLAGADQLERFFREARMAAGLHHTNIVSVFDVGQVAGTPYYAMQYIEGSSLDQILHIMQSASGQDAVDPSARIQAGLPGSAEDYFSWVSGIGMQAAEGLAYAHERKIIHRDIKPSNLLLDNQGVLWIADFGLARKIEDPAMTQSGVMLGTPRYMSPEQAESTRRTVDQRSDIYSLGATLYELLTCRPVFEGKTPQEVLSQIVTREPVAPRRLNPDIPADLAIIVMKAMAKRPDDRYQSARDLADDLEHWRKMEPINARPIGPFGRTIRWCRRNPRVSAITAAAIAVIVLLTGIYIAGMTKKNREIQAALSRAELGTAAVQAALRDDSQAYIRRATEIARLDQVMHGSENIELLPQAVNDLLIIQFSQKKESPEIRQVLAESEKRALEMARRAVDVHDARFVESIGLLGEYFEGKNDLHQAEWLYRQALALARPLPENRGVIERLTNKMKSLSEKRVELLQKEAESALNSGEIAKAGTIYREALKIRREISGGEDIRDVILERNLGSALVESGQLEEGEKVLRNNYRLCLTKLGKDNPSTQMVVRSLISLYATWKKQPEKIAEYCAALPHPEIVSIKELGAQSFTESGEGPFSAAWNGKQVWALGNTAGPGTTSSSWLWNDAGQKGDKLGPWRQRKDEHGRSLSLLPLTADEDEFNRARADTRCRENCQEYWNITPGPIIPLPGNKGALLFYGKNFIRPGDIFKNRSTVGTSIAIWKDPTAPAARKDLRPGAPEPTLLFQQPEPSIGIQAFAWANYLYAYGRTPDQGDQLIVARAPLDEALQRGAWRFYSGYGRWSEAWQEAVPVMKGYRGSIDWNWYLGKLVRVSNHFPSDNMLSISTSDRPEGPWSQSQDIPLGHRPDSRINYPLAHSELSEERGRVQYVTYQLETGLFKTETRFVEIVFK